MRPDRISSPITSTAAVTLLSLMAPCHASALSFIHHIDAGAQRPGHSRGFPAGREIDVPFARRIGQDQGARPKPFRLAGQGKARAPGLPRLRHRASSRRCASSPSSCASVASDLAEAPPRPPPPSTLTMRIEVSARSNGLENRVTGAFAVGDGAIERLDRRGGILAQIIDQPLEKQRLRLDRQHPRARPGAQGDEQAASRPRPRRYRGRSCPA